ncbi:conserved hypothetical protein [Prosthecochloris aestuarii DSM 271]|uniref:ResB-like domain-containing protein n=1 Tax=Prosthecochloris aestuarii (strain DSM 271 / SK 413) TaxID=290512 RepID=B4S465_PROA2|nr:cytochrome c biogenesis protein ResB [Prosthecochloris aestuarii]ACF46857.1 conserved hypothetical protein [Prosthecochloris aestuarii DSM 271]
MSYYEKNGGVAVWSFRESILFTVILLLSGLVLELLGGGNGVSLPSWPLNAIWLSGIVSGIVIAGIWGRQHWFIAWLGGIPLGLSLIFALAFLSFFGGVLPQEQGVGSEWVLRFRFNQVFSSWPFALVVLFFMINLGLSLVWKLVPFRRSNLQFILFHAGFWIALTCGLFGASDLQRVIIPLYEGEASSRGYHAGTKRTVDLPFSLHLNDFEMEEYAPQLGLYDPSRDRLEAESSNAVLQVDKGVKASWPELQVEVETYFPHALKDPQGKPVPSDTLAGTPYAFIRGTFKGKPFSGWVSTGSPHEEPVFIVLDRKLLVLIPGSAKKYRSEVMIRDERDNPHQVLLEVNRPVSINGWKLYQMGYDVEAGRWSKLSLVEGVRDPWLPAVYTGFFMILIGNVLFFWKGMKKTRVL